MPSSRLKPSHQFARLMKRAILLKGFKYDHKCSVHSPTLAPAPVCRAGEAGAGEAVVAKSGREVLPDTELQGLAAGKAKQRKQQHLSHPATQQYAIAHCVEATVGDLAGHVVVKPMEPGQ